MPLDADDISALYARHARRLVAFFTRCTYDAEAAVELMAETFAGAYASRARCRATTPEEVVAWLYTIARRRQADWLRHAVVERTALAKLGLDAPDMTDAELERIDELAGTAQLRAEVAQRLLTLAPEHQAALRLRVVEERSYEDVAAQLGVSEHHGAHARVAGAARARRRDEGGHRRWLSPTTSPTSPAWRASARRSTRRCAAIRPRARRRARRRASGAAHRRERGGGARPAARC